MSSFAWWQEPYWRIVNVIIWSVNLYMGIRNQDVLFTAGAGIMWGICITRAQLLGISLPSDAAGNTD